MVVLRLMLFIFTLSEDSVYCVFILKTLAFDKVIFE